MLPLDRLAATATRVSELPLDRGEVALSERVPEADTNPNTEVGKVGSALNRMLQHIANALTARQASESRVRQFVADASHELRTPLAAIRGYAELTRRSGEQVPPDIAFAMSRVESESRRMTTLVEDLLLLARLDSGRAVVPEWVDLCRLVADAVADAHVAGPDHKWLMDVPGEPIGVLGDAGQLHQVVINVLANARTHTPAGTTVTTTLSTSDGFVRLRVADDGPGIPPEILPDIFERFARGDNSRSRAAGSTGLGLAIVAAVAGAHGARVGVQKPAGTHGVRDRLRGGPGAGVTATTPPGCCPHPPKSLHNLASFVVKVALWPGEVGCWAGCATRSGRMHSGSTGSAQVHHMRHRDGGAHDDHPVGARTRPARAPGRPGSAVGQAFGGRAVARDRAALPVGPGENGLGQRLLRDGRAGRDVELESTVLRLARPGQCRHGRQTAVLPVGHGVVRPDLRVLQLEPAGAERAGRRRVRRPAVPRGAAGSPDPVRACWPGPRSR